MFLITSLLRYATCCEIHPFRGRTQRCQDIHEVVQCHYSQFGCFNLRGFKGARSPLTDGAAGLQAVTPLSLAAACGSPGTSARAPVSAAP